MDNRHWICLLPWGQKNKAESESAQIEYGPKPTITSEDIWNGLELLLVNRSSRTVWVEDVGVVLCDLDANEQAVVPTGQARHPILQNVGPSETLTVSLAREIYDAAGRPQGPFSCLVLTNVSYRAFNKWCNVQGWQRLPKSIFMGNVGTTRR